MHILILDEATSALDLESSNRVNKAFQENPATIIEVSHKELPPSARVIYLDQGKVIYDGPHEKFLTDPTYASLWNKKENYPADEKHSTLTTENNESSATAHPGKKYLGKEARLFPVVNAGVPGNQRIDQPTNVDLVENSNSNVVYVHRQI